ncbi:lipoprotein, putative [Oceanicola granulosus HTCC2516]|uniref:Lipoprotein, putative n=1 Tax=Oceanicola granulosus (strain ATCC BAA-861 / DSM 15982 / KCTC 12143 / HTCC2516) TaxID=314256 RepID=Q2CIV5_OCEGH|nr:hypothetical protein [Oceanicola granulosus]EAR52484.1 lipoprotein, putative [Oceanicola granulosus HTCC2516]
MAESSKILTVSYGTFSCTLEGFDDAFDTMKAIAEYFRDLAADDRYFGAEPATPDPEMLARIAEREAERRVEARLEQGGYVLRPSLAPAAAAQPAAPADAPASAPAEEAPAPAPAAEEKDPAPQGYGEHEGEERPWAELDQGERRLIRRARRARRDAERAAAAEAKRRKAEEDAARKQAEEAERAAAAKAAEDAARREAEEAARKEAEEAEAAARRAAEAAIAEQSQRLELEPDSVAAKLARIRAVVGRSPAPSAPQQSAGYEDEETPSDTPAAAPQAAPVDPLRAILTEPEAEAAGEAGTDAPEADDRVVPISRDEDETGRAETAGRSGGIAELDGLEELDELVGRDGDDDDTGLSPDEEADLLAELAEVERIGADEGETETAEAVTEEDASEGETEEIAVAEDAEGEDAAEDEAARAETEAPAEADEAALPAEEEAAAPEADAAPEEAAGRRRRAGLLAGSPDEARILSETDAQLNEPEGNRRRQAIAHLKAAVAATEAARRLGEGERAAADDGEEGENMFRDDLDQVVRPRRAPRALSRSDRPKPAPLKLVASQRIDVPPAPAEEPAGPVRPRRVQSGGASARPRDGESNAGFAKFAADMGATGLADLLECAAAHEAFIQGNDDVSRPQIMKKVQSIMPEQFSREDGLRAFGTLLRQGRLEKVRNGRFQVAQTTRFRPTKAASNS